MTITAILQDRNVRTANSFHQDGSYFLCCDLANGFGSVGAGIAATRGRYVWLASADHSSGKDEQSQSGSWQDGQHVCIGFSSDPGIMPESFQPVIRGGFTSPDATTPADTFHYSHVNDFVYNPDDTTYPFYLYLEGYVMAGPDSGVRCSHEQGLVRSADLFNWVGYGATHLSQGFTGFTSYQRVVRNGTGDWFSIGPHYLGFAGEAPSLMGKWTSSNGLSFTTNPSVDVPYKIGNTSFNYPVGKPMTVNVGGQDYMITREDARTDDGGMWLTAVAVDANFGVLATPAKIRLSAMYDGLFPSLGYMQSLSTYLEDGILHVYVSHGFYSDEANPSDGNHEQAYDYYTIILDATAAANAAPCGVRAECRYGAVIVTWRDALPNKTYRVYRSTTGIGGTYTSLGDVTGLNFVDPVGNVGALYYYKVVTRHSSADQGARIVGVYVSSGRHLTNEHIKRVTLAGGTNINAGWLDTVTGWLRDNALTNHLLFWADPSFGVVQDGSNHLSKVFCLGSTLHAYGGDYTPQTPASTTYNATGLASTIPAWVNGSAAYGYFGGGRLNNIRRKAEITFAAVYSRPSGSSTATFFGTSEFGGIYFQHVSGTPGDIEFHFLSSGYDVHASKTTSSATAAHFAVGTFDGTNIIAYCDGVAGTPPTTGVLDNVLLDGARGEDTGLQQDFLGSGSADVKYRFNRSGLGGSYNNPDDYIFEDNQSGFSCSALIVFDIALTPAQITSLNTLLQARIGGASYSLPSYDTPFVKNIVTDYSATGNGTSDDAGAFGSFASAVATWQATHTGLVVLQVPAGGYRFQTNHSTFTKGIPLFLMLGESRESTQLICTPGDSGFFLGSAGGTIFDAVGMHSARINTASAGATSVSLKSSGDAAIFSAGKFVVIAAGDFQGYGDPINPNIFEFKKIASIVGGTLNLTEPLENTYPDTWPLYNDGSSYITGGGGDKGGPATVFYLDPAWDCEHEYRELEYQQIGASDGEIKGPGRFITHTKCRSNLVVGGVHSELFPSENYHWTLNDFEQINYRVEVDKVINVATINGGVFSAIEFQSSSPNRFELIGGAITGTLNGSPRTAYLDGFYVSGDMHFGPNGYGVCNKVVALNGVCGALVQGGFKAGLSGDISDYTMSGGIITVPHTADVPAWAVPGATLLWSAGSAANAGSFKVTGISQPGGIGTATLVATDQAGGFPSLGGTIGIRTHPGSNVILRGVTNPVIGVAVVIPTPSGNSFNCECRSMSHVAPFVPLYSRAQYRYSAALLNAAPPFKLFGQVVSITVAVPSPYIGIHTPLLMGIFGQFGGNVVHPDGTQAFWNPQIDLRTAGTRVITPSGVTGATGLDANLTMPTTPAWIVDTFQPYIAFDILPEASPPNGPTDAGMGPDAPVVVTFVLDQSAMTLTGAATRTFACHFV